MTKSRKNPKMYQKCQKYQGQSNKHARRRPFSAVRASLALAVDGFASSRGALQDPHQEGARNMKNPADWEKHKAKLGATTAAQNNHRTTARPSHSVHANALSLGFLPFGSAHLSASPILCGQFYLAPQFLRKRTFKSKTGVFRETSKTWPKVRVLKS